MEFHEDQDWNYICDRELYSPDAVTRFRDETN